MENIKEIANGLFVELGNDSKLIGKFQNGEYKLFSKIENPDQATKILLYTDKRTQESNMFLVTNLVLEELEKIAKNHYEKNYI